MQCLGIAVACNSKLQRRARGGADVRHTNLSATHSSGDVVSLLIPSFDLHSGQ